MFNYILCSHSETFGEHGPKPPPQSRRPTLGIAWRPVVRKHVETRYFDRIDAGHMMAKALAHFGHAFLDRQGSSWGRGAIRVRKAVRRSLFMQR
jgi:hypothetical protein